MQARTVEKDPGLLSALDSPEKQTETYLGRLSHARIEGPGITLAYMADDKTHVIILTAKCKVIERSDNLFFVYQKEDVEALLRSSLLVMMDNGTSEYAFVTTFFAPEPDLPPVHTPRVVSSHLFSPPSLSAPLPVDDAGSNPASDVVPVTPRPRERGDSILSNESMHSASRLSKEDQTALNAIWKQIMDPALEHTKVVLQFSVSCAFDSRSRAQTFAQTALDPLPPVIPLLTMIRLTEEVMGEIQKRGCHPLEGFVFDLRLKMWPLFQRAMTDQIEGLKKVAEGAGGGYFRRTTTTSDATITTVRAKPPCDVQGSERACRSASDMWFCFSAS